MVDDKLVELPGPGRPTKIARAPSARRARQIRETQMGVECHAAQDPLVSVAAQRNVYETLSEARLAMAVEAASVGFQRSQLPAHDRRFRTLAARRISILAEVGRLTVELHRLGADEPSPALIARIVEMFRAQIEEVAREVLPAADAERLLAVFNRKVEVSTSTVAGQHRAGVRRTD